jgi:hypothetical protein
MFGEITRACIRFVSYKEPVPCAVCGRQSKKHWTSVVRFKAANLKDNQFVVKLSRRYLDAGKPVCRDHPLQPDEALFIRKARAAMRKQKSNPAKP